MASSDLACGTDARRLRLFDHPRWNGIDFLETSDQKRSLCVHFFGTIPAGIGVANVRIEGGRRIRDLRVMRVEIDRADDPELDDCLRIELDKIGDHSTYRLCLVERADQQGEGEQGQGKQAYRPFHGLDPRYACLDFQFRLDCPADLDCLPVHDCPPPAFAAPEIDYLAKDYASLRQMMLDRMALTMPDWQERHAPDVGLTLVEVLAYTGDYLSYYQDAVATEAYLDTARERISVRRHVRLVDYRMHEGCNARAFISLQSNSNLGPLPFKDVYFITGFAALDAYAGSVVPHAVIETYPASAYEVFEPVARAGQTALTVRAAHSQIALHTWGDTECCLAKGATRATLVDGEGSRVLDLHPGDVLIFEEVRGAGSGAPADADPAHRHPVLLTRVTQEVDDLLEQMVLEVEWASADALPFALCISVRLSSEFGCARIGGVTVARGNVVLVDHGRRAPPDPLGPVTGHPVAGDCACDGSVITTTSVPDHFRAQLKQRDLTYKVMPVAGTSADAMLAQDPRAALPDLVLAQRPDGELWQPRHDLLDSDAEALAFVVEMDDERRAHLRFGNGDLGRQPPKGTLFDSSYRTGTGIAGNVGRDVIAAMVYRPGVLDGVVLTVRNPNAASGGVEPEPVAEVKLLAPNAFRTQRMRAVTAADYAELAQRNSELQRAAADLSWTGSWYEARVTLDPLARQGAPQALLDAVAGELHPFRRIGHDLAVVAARYVPIRLTLRVCVLAHFARGQVRASLLEVLGNKRLANGELGLFHPDRLSFGEGVRLSRIVAAAAGVAGVENVKVLRLQRMDVPEDPLAPMPEDDPAIADGMLAMGPTEIAQLDNDPDFVENGTLTLLLGGGR